MNCKKAQPVSKEFLDFITDNIASKEDIIGMSLTINFAGRGEMLTGQDEILSKIFGWSLGSDLYKLMYYQLEKEERDYEKIADSLTGSPGTEVYMRNTLLSTVRLWMKVIMRLKT